MILCKSVTLDPLEHCYEPIRSRKRKHDHNAQATLGQYTCGFWSDLNFNLCVGRLKIGLHGGQPVLLEARDTEAYDIGIVEPSLPGAPHPPPRCTRWKFCEEVAMRNRRSRLKKDSMHAKPSYYFTRRPDSS